LNQHGPTGADAALRTSREGRLRKTNGAVTVYEEQVGIKERLLS
jgi:hypothetical protein